MIVEQKMNHEYPPIQGFKSFNAESVRLAYGLKFNHSRIAAVQTLSGAGALRVGCEFLSQWCRRNVKVYIPKPTWIMHRGIAESAGLQVAEYTYYDFKKKQVAFEQMYDELLGIPDEQIVILHACAHNPTGDDPTEEQWDELKDLFIKKGHYAFFDSAYQGFASGNPDADVYSLRSFANSDARVLLAQSFAKNFGLYGQRIGCLSVVTDEPHLAGAVTSQLKGIVRPMWSNPPVHGARIVDTVLKNPELMALWKTELMQMATRIKDMRHGLTSRLRKLESPHDWSHIDNQIGMFAYTGLNPEQCR